MANTASVRKRFEAWYIRDYWLVEATQYYAHLDVLGCLRFAPLNRAQGAPDILVNSDMGPAEVQRFCELDETGKNLMRAAVQQMKLSARAYHCVLKLARTSADLAGKE